jgi:beta-galactosidase
MKPSFRRASRRTLIVAAVGTLLVAGGHAALAAWSTTTSNPGNSFSTTTLGAPTGLTAVQSGRGYNLSWTPASGTAAGLAQNVQEGINGAAPVTVGGVGGTASTYFAGNLLGDTLYCFDVQTTYDNWLATGSTTCPAAFAPTFAVNAGGGAAGWYVGSTGFNSHCSAGTTTTNAINTAQVPNPAPQAVYQSAMTAPNNFGSQQCIWTHSGLTPNATYQLRFQFAELTCTTVGCRDMNVSVQGTAVLTNFDIFAAAGGEFIAITRTFAFTADATGTVTVAFAAGKSPALVNGIEIL